MVKNMDELILLQNLNLLSYNEHKLLGDKLKQKNKLKEGLLKRELNNRGKDVGKHRSSRIYIYISHILKGTVKKYTSLSFVFMRRFDGKSTLCYKGDQIRVLSLTITLYKFPAVGKKKITEKKIQSHLMRS